MEAMPYIVAVLTAIISGLISYLLAIKKGNDEIRQLKIQNQNDLEKLEKQNKLDIEKQKEIFYLELEKQKLAHQNNLETLDKQGSNAMAQQLTTSLLGGLFTNPEGITQLLGSLPEWSEQLKKINDSKKDTD